MPACRAGSVSTDRLCVLPEGDLCEPVTGGGQTQARTHPAASLAAIGSGRAARARVRLVLPSLAGPGGPWPAPRPVLAEGGVDPELWEPEPVGSLPVPMCPFPAQQLSWRAESGSEAREASSGEEKEIHPTATRPPRDAELAFCFGWKPGFFGRRRPTSLGCDVPAEDADL